MRKIKFTHSQVGCDRKHYLTESDVMTVLNRLPQEAWNRLRAGHFNDKSWGANTLGYANAHEHEICICALPQLQRSPQTSRMGFASLVYPMSMVWASSLGRTSNTAD